MNFCARELMQLGRYDLAARIAQLVVAEDERSPDAYSLVADALDELGRWPEALKHWQRAAELAVDSALARFNLALAVLRLGDYRTGLELYEARIDKPDWTGFSALTSRAAVRQKLLQPGAPVAGRTILVLAEQGLGDCIMFARYIPVLAERGARVLLACSPELNPMFARIPGIAQLLSPPSEQPMAKLNLLALAFDAWVPLLSLPLHTGEHAIEPFANVPYLRPDESRIAHWRTRYEARGHAGAPKIGIVYQANPAGRAAADKSLSPEDLAPLLAFRGVDWIVLHQGAAARTLATAHSGVIDPDLVDAGLDEFASAVAATDLLLTVDTMAAHCAGAIGHPAWVAVPSNPHWYWGINGDGTPWYPTLRLFRQDAPRDWSGALRRMREELRARFQASG